MALINGNELNFTEEQLAYFEKEMKAYKLPWISAMHYKYGVPFIRFGIAPIIVFFIVTFFIYNGSTYGENQWIWIVDKAIALFLIYGFGGFTLLA